MASFLRYLPIITAALALGACDPRFVHGSDLNPREVQQLSAVYEGTAALSFSSERDCVRVYRWTVRVASGNADGEIVDDKTPNATPSRFSTFIDYDGSLHVVVRLAGINTDVLGSFSRDSFSGTARAKECSYAVRLRRRASS
jgi:hypothetical protein